MQKQFIRRICDYCNEKQEFDVSGLTPVQEEQMQNWITLAREVVVNGQPVPLIKHACRLTCAQNVLTTGGLDIPDSLKATPDNKIDVSSLRKVAGLN